MQALADALAAVGYDRAAILMPELDERFELGIGIGPIRHRLPPRLPPEQVRAREDWHNEYARTVLSLEERLRALPDDQERAALLARIREAIEAGRRRGG